ncbi:MAG: nitrous oxide reductase family maturation protein NosD [Burkholderiales bacterium]|nr:nitrous oxide reductase family maturation protein NosD [Burkholderiales bacterium]
MALIWAHAQPLSPNPLQDAIDRAAAGSTLKLSRGLYRGAIHIDKPLSLIAEEKGAVIRGNGIGTVIRVTANHVTLSGITVEGSGDSHQSIDACVAVINANNVKVLNLTLRDCLFGVNFEGTHKSLIENNTITSKPFSSGLKGDGIRLWYSHANIIRGNVTQNVRDNVLWYSSANRIENNRGEDSRYALHFMYADRNVVTHNRYEHNSVGIFMMYSHGSNVSNNIITHASDAFGIGIGMKEVSDCKVEDNHLMYNARGLYLDQSPYQPDTVNRFIGNRLSYNTIAIQMHGTLLGSDFERNLFKGNIDDVANDTPESRLDLNRWFNNYWDNYEGFDRNRDGYGDTPHEQFAYADKMWSYRPSVKFFYGSPVMSLLNFLYKLMPFSEPDYIASDPKPMMRPDHAR